MINKHEMLLIRSCFKWTFTL